MVNIFTIPDFVLHILNFFLGWIKAHTSHHIGNGTQRNFTIQLTSLGCMLVFGPNLTVVEEVFEIAHHLTVGSSFQQVRKRVTVGLLIEALSKN